MKLFLLDVPENVPVVEVGRRAATVARLGPYFVIESAEPIVIDRRATGCRHAVWYSCVGGLQNAHIVQFDKDVLRLEAM